MSNLCWRISCHDGDVFDYPSCSLIQAIYMFEIETNHKEKDISTIEQV